MVLTWTDNSASETTFTLQRDTTTGFLAPTSFPVGPSAPASAYGGTITYNDTTATAGPYYYRVQANDAFTPSPNTSPAFPTTPPPGFVAQPLSSGWSNLASATATLLPQAVTFTGAPVTAAYNATFTVVATTNASVMPTIAGVGVCSVGAVSGTPAGASATVTMTSGTGNCTLTADWAATTTFLAASASQFTTAKLSSPTVSFAGAPAAAPNGATFTVTATTNAGIAPTINGSASVCTVGTITGTSPATALVTMISGTGTCNLTAAWAATTNYAAASANLTTVASLATPTVSFTGAPANAVYGSSFIVTAGTNAGVMPTIAPTGVCSVGPLSGTSTGAMATVTMTSGTGACGLTASWPASTLYKAASLAQSTAATKLASATVINSNLPSKSVVGQSVTVSFSVTGALAAPTGNVTVTATTGESCSAALSAGAGACSLTFATAGSRNLTALYNGDANYGTSTSAPASESVGDFAIGVSPASNSVNGGQNAKYTLTLTPISGFTGSVGLACSSAPALPTAEKCTITPTSVTLGGGTQRANVTVSTVKGNPGTYTLTFTGTNSYSVGSLVHTTTSGLTVKK